MLFAGTVIAPGIAFGPAVVWDPDVQKVQVRKITSGQVKEEFHRLDYALRCAREELESIAVRVLVSVGKSAAAIFRAHQLLLADDAFTSPIRKAIEEDHVSAETAVSVTVEQFARQIAAIPNQYFAARSEDFADLGWRLLIHLGQESSGRSPVLATPSILLAENLSAADVVALDRTKLLALIMTQSGSNSHAALLAATLGVPVVGGVPQLWGQARNGDTIIVDGNHGHVVVRPTDLAMRQYRTRREIFDRFCGEVAGLREVPAETVDGRRVRLTANVGVAEDVPHALAKGAEGIGLVRTEYFLLTQRDPTSEEEQYRFYASIVDQMSPRPVTFRTFDLGGDKGTHGLATPETNHAELETDAQTFSQEVPLKLFVAEAYVVPTNAMAPTIIGYHRETTCPRCGGTLILSAPEPNNPFPPPIDEDRPGICVSCRKASVKPGAAATVHPPDRILVNKLLTPARWDVIVFRYPEEPSQKYVMRLVGLPGEKVHIKGDSLWINDAKMDVPADISGLEYTAEMEFAPDLKATEENPLLLGADQYCVLGDFSKNSSDSRLWGPVPGANIEGVVCVRYWPMQRWYILR